MVDVVGYYSRSRVCKEIAEFLRGRKAFTVAADGSKHEVEVHSPSSITEHARRGARSFYGSPAVNGSCTVAWRITPSSPDYWALGLEAARTIVDFLSEKGVKSSVYLTWDGEGFEVRVHEDALKGLEDPVGCARSIECYVLHKVRSKLYRIGRLCGLRVEAIDPEEGALIAPLSLHPKLTRCAVYFKPEAMESFEPRWSDLDVARHDPESWRRAVVGEARGLAMEAAEWVKSRGKAEPTRLEVQAAKLRGPGRFEVMALLQAARYYLLKGDLDKAKSFGLNRAIFYAWAKHYGPRSRAFRIYRGGIRAPSAQTGKGAKPVTVLGEATTVSPRGWFEIGGEEQLPVHFDRQVASKIEMIMPFDVAWRQALRYLKKFPRKVLEDQRLFFKYVYEPVRDLFLDRVVLGKDQDKIAGEAWKRIPPKPKQSTLDSLEGSA